MLRRCCKTPPTERKSMGTDCENKWKNELKSYGHQIIELPQNFGADFASLSPNGTLTFNEVKSGCSKPTPNQQNLQQQVSQMRNDKIHHEILACDCNGNLLNQV